MAEQKRGLGFEVKRRLLKRAFQQNRGFEVILLILWRQAASRHSAEQDISNFKIFDFENKGNPQSVRMLNLLALKDGKTISFTDEANPFKTDSVLIAQ